MEDLWGLGLEPLTAVTGEMDGGKGRGEGGCCVQSCYNKDSK